jgi:hypothetical protein
MKRFKVLNQDDADRELHVGSTPAPGGFEGEAVGLVLWDGAAARLIDPAELAMAITTCDQAERIAAKLLESAWVVRHRNGQGPKPTFGPKGREKMLARLARAMGDQRSN